MMNPAEFENIARAEASHWWYRGMRAILYRMLDPILRGRRISRVLEAGCGTGYMARLLAQRYRWRMFPVDLGWDGLTYARANRGQHLTQADITHLPFPDDTFDAVVSLDVIVHFPRGEEGRAMAELARVLKPGGLMVIRVAALDVLRSRHSQHAFERQRFTRGRLVQLARRHGIGVLRASYANSLLLPVAWLKFRVWEPLSAAPPASGVQMLPTWLDRSLGSPLALEAAWLGMGRNFPLGQSLILIGEKS